MTQPLTITTDKTLVLPSAILEQYPARQFLVTSEKDQIILKPLNDDTFELSAEGAQSLTRALDEEQEGLTRPIDQLDI